MKTSPGHRSLTLIKYGCLAVLPCLVGCGGSSGSTGGIGNDVGGSSDIGGTSSTQVGGSSTAGGSSNGVGGANTTGGALATGGLQAAGGNTTAATGGVKATGGSTNIGLSTGGALNVGGTAATGGAVNTGGTKATGGSSTATPTGGSQASGGAPATGGSRATGGTTNTSTPTGGTKATGGAATGGAGTGGSSSTGSDLWIATDGSDSNPGTQAQPFKTLTYAHSRASAGVTIWIKPGTYAWSSTVNLSKNGTASSPINVFAAAGARPVIDFSGQPRDTSSARGIEISGTYWHIKGIDVTKAGDNCIHIAGSHNTVEWVSIHGCCDSGLQITADTASDASRGAYNTILNCDSYENYDTATGGENADGFSPKLHIGPGNVFRGCRSWNNADDGYDLFASDDVVVIDHCWAFLNGKLANGGGTSAGDGNGFKLGGAATAGDAYEGGAPHQVTDCFAFENLACGYTRNNNTSVPTISASGGRADGKGEYCSLTNPSPVSFTMTGAQAKAVQRNADGSLPEIQ